MNKIKSVAMMQVFILLVGIVSFTYAVGSEVGFVGASGGSCNSDSDVLAGVQTGTNGIPYFCYGGSSQGYQTYTVTSGNTIQRDDGVSYTKNGNDWIWQGATSSGTVDINVDGSFYGLANSAIGQYPSPQTDAHPPVSSGAPANPNNPPDFGDGTYWATPDGENFVEVTEAMGEDDEGNVVVENEDLLDDILAPIAQVSGAVTLYETVSGQITAGLEKIGVIEITEESVEVVKIIAETTPTITPTQAYGPVQFDPLYKPYQAKIVKPSFWDTLTGSFFGEKGTFFIPLEGQGVWAYAGYLAQTYGVAIVTAVAIRYAAEALGASDRNVQGISTTAWIAAGGVSALSTILAATSVGGPPGWAVGVAIIAITGIYTFVQYQTYAQEIFTFQPIAWQPKDGGDDCNKCNIDLRYGCNEYQCHSFGKDCVLLNEGTGDEKCAANDPNDRTPPFMKALEGILGSEKYEYRDSGIVSPPERGVKIFNTLNQDGCLPAFSSVIVGIETDEVADCMIDVERRQEYDEMISHMSSGTNPNYNFTHTITLPHSATPSIEAMNHLGWNTDNGKQHEFYMRCKDNNGNIAPMNFIIEFCIDDGPDTSAPNITGTNYLQESYIQNGLTSAPLEVYTDEPATCKWDSQDLDYDVMTNEMDWCSLSANDYIPSAAYTYGCSGELTGLKDGVDNKFYIKCKDKPWLEGQENEEDRIARTDPYILTLKGSIPLELISISVDGQTEEEGEILIKDSTDEIKVTLEVKTAAGAEDGLARCSYKYGNVYYEFYNEGSVEYVYPNVQELHGLSEGDYEYPIKCEDKGGNIAEGSVSFEVETDFDAPIVVRAYYEEGDLKLITNEEATCFYDTRASTGCSFIIEDDGPTMTSSDNLIHSYTWNTNSNIYVKCRDEYLNQPISGCSIIVRPFEFF